MSITPAAFPPEGIVCFHCGMRMKEWAAAADHFGIYASPSRPPACASFVADLCAALDLDPETVTLDNLVRIVQIRISRAADR